MDAPHRTAHTLAEIVELLHGWYPPGTAESWDAVGLVWGDPDAEVRRVMFAVDPTPEVAAEAAGWDADLLVVHHPLFLKPVHGFAPTTPKGRTLQTLVGAGCGLLTAHTNADIAVDGVSAAMAQALGLAETRPILPADGEAMDKLTVFVPAPDADALREALARAGAGAIGEYDACSFSSVGEGRFRPGAAANPTIGESGRLETVEEVRIECVLARGRRDRVVAALRAAHPYEEPAFDVVEMVETAGSEPTGTGRIGRIEPESLADFAARVAAALPATAGGVRVAGDPERRIERVAVCGGSGDFLLDRMAGADVDVYVTSDLRHHPAAEFVEKSGPALVDVAHWAAEWTWLPVVRKRLQEAVGDTVETRVSTRCTDPWTFHQQMTGPEQ